jgi:hypothetical protein
MPFDGLPTLDKPSLAALSFALRHPETWPEGFVWDYGNCETCAMGLANRLWGGILNKEPYAGESACRMASVFGIRQEKAFEIFIFAPANRQLRLRGVTPTQIADLIDAHLANVDP